MQKKYFHKVLGVGKRREKIFLEKIQEIFLDLGKIRTKSGQYGDSAKILTIPNPKSFLHKKIFSGRKTLNHHFFLRK